ncbi:hypothetical protein D3C78_473890 [compost metagenome]
MLAESICRSFSGALIVRPSSEWRNFSIWVARVLPPAESVSAFSLLANWVQAATRKRGQSTAGFCVTCSVSSR